MTEKRFIYCEEENGEFPFPYIKYDGKTVISLYECVDLLNSLNNENEQLKETIVIYDATISNFNELKKENEQLKEIIDQLFNTITELDWAKEEYCNALIRLLGEENDVNKAKQRIREFLE